MSENSTEVFCIWSQKGISMTSNLTEISKINNSRWYKQWACELSYIRRLAAIAASTIIWVSWCCAIVTIQECQKMGLTSNKYSCIIRQWARGETGKRIRLKIWRFGLSVRVRPCPPNNAKDLSWWIIKLMLDTMRTSCTWTLWGMKCSMMWKNG